MGDTLGNLTGITLSKFLKFQATMFAGVHIEMLLFGNVDKHSAVCVSHPLFRPLVGSEIVTEGLVAFGLVSFRSH